MAALVKNSIISRAHNAEILGTGEEWEMGQTRVCVKQWDSNLCPVVFRTEDRSDTSLFLGCNLPARVGLGKCIGPHGSGCARRPYQG